MDEDKVRAEIKEEYNKRLVKVVFVTTFCRKKAFVSYLPESKKGGLLVILKCEQ